MRLVSWSFCACASAICVAPAMARETIAFLQFSNSSGATQLVYQMDATNENICNALNENHWRGIKTNCPDCKKEQAGCLSELPSSYTGMLSNKSIVLPYLSSENDRIIIVGMPMGQAIEMCKTMAEGYRNKLNRQASCITPN